MKKWPCCVAFSRIRPTDGNKLLCVYYCMFIPTAILQLANKPIIILSCIILPFNADCDETEHGGVEREHEDVSVQPTEHCPKQPASVQHELYDVRHPDDQNQEIGHCQIDNEQIRHGTSHLLVGEDDDNHEGIADDADDNDQREEARYSYEWSGVDGLRG